VLILAACSSILVAFGSAVGISAAAGTTSRADTEISLMYSQAGMAVSPAALDVWIKAVKKRFEATHPGATLKLIPTPGTDTDQQNKVKLSMRSASTSPDVAFITNSSLGDLQASGYLRPMTKYARSSDFWKKFPSSVKAIGTYKGNVYGISLGNNLQTLFYNKKLFRKAGIALPWQPKTWAQLLQTLKTLKAKLPGVAPLFLQFGEGPGLFGSVNQTFANLLVGSSTPYMVKPNTGKWVVDSRGLRESLGFYKQVFSQGLAQPASTMTGANAWAQVMIYLKDDKAAVTLGSNWHLPLWKLPGDTNWPNVGASSLGLAKIPKQKGGGYANLLGGWMSVVSVHASPARAKLAEDLITLMQRDSSLVQLAKACAFVPPTQTAASSRGFLSFLPPHGVFSSYMSFATAAPADPGFAGYGRGVLLATSAIANDPSLEIDDLIKTIRTETETAVGASGVTTMR
jgi:multiple sugar transport system substrate-binding protein